MVFYFIFFFFNDTATTEIYTLSLHDALPICVRTGLPNKAASTWASSVVREPLTGVDVVCPVTPQTVMVVLSPRKTVDAFMRLHDLPADAFGPGRTLLLNGIKVTAKDLEVAV